MAEVRHNALDQVLDILEPALGGAAFLARALAVLEAQLANDRIDVLPLHDVVAPRCHQAVYEQFLKPAAEVPVLV